jgi:hypothetical protein
MHKGQEGRTMTICYEFGNDPMKMCFKLELCKILFLLHRL